jgi:hypothetical protein
MVFVVYADDEGRVFDWDWVRADPANPDYPIGWERRFVARAESPPRATLRGLESLSTGQFDPKRAVYSPVGDCVFAYFNDAPSFANRVNSDLTVFRDIASKEATGCKIKNIRNIVGRIVETHEEWRASADGLEVVVSISVPVPLILAQSYLRQYNPGSDEQEAIEVYPHLLTTLHELSPQVFVPRPERPALVP